MIQNDIRRLVAYGVQTGLVPMEDVIYTTNRLLELFELEEMDISEEAKEAGADGQAVGMESADGQTAGMTSADGQTAQAGVLEEILGRMCDYACEHGLIAEDSVVYRDLFDTKVMGMLMPRPSEVIQRFRELYETESPLAATDYYYKLSKDSDYIRSGLRPPNMGIWTLPLICPSRRRIPKPLLRPKTQNSQDIPNACCVGKMRDMRVGSIIPPDKIIALYP